MTSKGPAHQIGFVFSNPLFLILTLSAVLWTPYGERRTLINWLCFFKVATDALLSLVEGRHRGSCNSALFPRSPRGGASISTSFKRAYVTLTRIGFVFSSWFMATENTEDTEIERSLRGPEGRGNLQCPSSFVSQPLVLCP
jgi:hypothetical protein